MIPPTPEIRGLARWLLAQEASADRPSGKDVITAASVCNKLRKPVSTLAGVTGYSSLLARALTLAKAEAPALGAARVKPDGSLDGLSATGSPGHLNAGQGAEILIAHLLGLLMTFIGQPLTLRLVRDVWPDAPFGYIDPDSEARS